MKKYNRLFALMIEIYNFSHTEAEALLRGVESEASTHFNGRERVIRRCMQLRHVVACKSLQRRYPAARDMTMYCIDMGYTGKRRVMVLEGKVVSHAHADWHAFACRIRNKKAA